MTRLHTLFAVAAGFAFLGAPGAPAASDSEATYQNLMDTRGTTLVTVKFVLKVSGGGFFAAMGDQENEQETSGVMISSQGLVLVSNTQLAGWIGMARGFLGEMGGDVSAVPTDLKVLVGDDTEGLEAELLARDTELDLAWVKIKEPGERTFAAVDFADSAKPSPGQQLLMLARMGKYFERALLVHELRVAGLARKPRELYVPSSAAGLGLPVYTTDGKVVGLTVFQAPETEGAGENPFAMFSQLSDMQSAAGGLILPAEEVLRATKRAQATLAEDEEAD